MSDPFQTHAAFSWCELRTGDPAAARKFYTEVIGWVVEEMDMGSDSGPYLVLKAADAPVGGILANPAGEGAPDHWMSFVTVDDVDTRTAKATAAGGTVLMEPFDVPGVGRIAAIADPTGATISLITYAPREG